MHGERPTPEHSMSSEQEDNVLEFPHQEPPAKRVSNHIRNEHGLHHSAVLLSESGLNDAQAELSELETKHKKLLADINGNFKSWFNKKKDKEPSIDDDPKSLPEISARIHKLKSDIAFTALSGGPYKPMSKEDFDKLSPHEKSMSILKEAGFASIEDAEATNPAPDSMLDRKITAAKKTASKEDEDEYQVIPKKDNVITPEVWNPKAEPGDVEEPRKAA